MGMFGKGKQSESVDSLNSDVVHELETAARKKFTGALDVTDVATKQVATLYMFEGGLYAVALPGFVPSIPDRLRVAGTITLDQARLLTVPGSDWPSPLAGPVAVEQGWLNADALAALHQEYLVASLGAVLALSKVKIKSRKGESTKDFCTLPLPVDPIFDTLRMRGGRLAAGWAAITAEGTPATVALESRQVAPPADMTLPEFSALVAAVDGHQSVDAVAYGLGLTRAEVVHMAMLLVRAGVLRVAPQPAVVSRADRLLVPEAYGTMVPRAAEPVPVPSDPGADVPSPPVLEPELEAAPEAAPEAEVTMPGSALLATSSVFAADQAFGSRSPIDDSAEAAAEERSAAPAPIGTDDAVEDASAPGWAAALLAAEAVSVSHAETVDTETAMATDRAEQVVAAVQDEPVQPWAAPTPSAPLAMPEPEPVPEPVPAAPAPRVPDEHVLLLRRELAQSEVAELEHLLAKVTEEEAEAITRASSVRARLNSAKEAVSRVDAELGRSPRN